MKTPTTKKAPAEPRVSWQQTNYSPAALALMQVATGQRINQLPPPAPKPPVQAVDAD